MIFCIQKGFRLRKGGVDTNPSLRWRSKKLRFVESSGNKPVVDGVDCRGRRCKGVGDLLSGPVLFIGSVKGETSK